MALARPPRPHLTSMVTLRPLWPEHGLRGLICPLWSHYGLYGLSTASTGLICPLWSHYGLNGLSTASMASFDLYGHITASMA